MTAPTFTTRPATAGYTTLWGTTDRGALRDYFDLMVLDEHISIEEGLTLLVEKYQPIAPEGLIANVVRGLGYFDDVEDDPSLPVPRADIEAFWTRRQPEMIATLAI